MSRLFIPEKIHVGFNSRSSTYTKKLAYIIYTDEKGKKRKEVSWENWRDKNIPVEDYDNVPTEGFVLNKKVGGYKSYWNFRNAYVRVYDPRGFEFEITVENLLFILENTSSIIGKGLEGKFVYSWDGQDLVLLPTNSQNYIESTEYTKQLATAKKIGAKDMELGKVYTDKQLRRYVFLGRKQGYSFNYDTGEYKLSKGKHFWFLRLYDKANITEKDIELLKEIYKNRANYEIPFELDYPQEKGYIESFSGISSKFIQMSDTIDTLALAYGELLLKDDTAYNKQEQKIIRKPLSIEDINAYYKGIFITSRGYKAFKRTALENPLISLKSKLSQRNGRISSITRKYGNLDFGNSLDYLVRLPYQYSTDSKKQEFTNPSEVLELFYVQLTSNIDFSVLQCLLEEDMVWIEAERKNGKLIPVVVDEQHVPVNKFENNKEYLGVVTFTVGDLLEQLELEEVYHENHLVRKGIVNK